MSAFSIIGNNSGTCFWTLSGVKQGVCANTTTNKQAIFSLLSSNYVQATDGSFSQYNVYINTGIPFVAGTTEDTSLATLLSGATEVTDALQYNTWTQDLAITSTQLSWVRQNSYNIIRVTNTGTINNINVASAADGDTVLLTTIGNVVTVTGSGNIAVNSDFIFTTGSSLMLVYGVGGWQEVNRSVAPLTTATTNVSTSGITKTLDPSIDARYQIITGTGTLLGNSSFDASAAPDGFQWYIDYRAIFSGTSTFSVFGITMTAEQTLKGNSLFLATYDSTLSGYRVEQVLDFLGLTGTDIITDANIKSVSASKITGTLDPTNIPQLDPSKIDITEAYLLLGNTGNTGHGVSMSGDGTIDKDGRLNVPQKTVAFTSDVALAAATPEFIGQLAMQTASGIAYYGTAISTGAWSACQLTSPILTFKVAVSSAQVLQLYTNPVQLVPTQGDGKVIELIAAFGYIVYNTTPYATHTSLTIINSTATKQQFNNTTLLTTTTTTGTNFSIQTAAGGTDTQLVANQPLVLSCLVGDPTAGDSDITIYGTYRIWTL